MAATFQHLHSSSQEDAVHLTGTSSYGDHFKWKRLSHYLIVVSVALAILSIVLIFYISSLNPNSQLKSCDSNQNFELKSEGYFRQFIYPRVRRDLGIVETHHGVEIPDPYRWLDSDSKERNEFIKNENTLTESFLKKAKRPPKNWSKLRHQLKNVWESPWHQVPTKIGDKYFIFYRLPTDNIQGADPGYKRHYSVRSDLNGTEKILLDQTEEGIQPVSYIDNVEWSSNGGIMAYSYPLENGLNHEENEIREYKLKFRNVSTAINLPDILEFNSISELFITFTFSNDNKNFYYIHVTLSKGDSTLVLRVMSHVLGTRQTEDKILGEVSVKNYTAQLTSTSFSNDGKYLFVTMFAKQTTIFVMELEVKGNLVPLTRSQMVQGYEYIENEGPIFLFHKLDGDANGKIIKIDARHALSHPDQSRLPLESTFLDSDPVAILKHVNVLDKDKLILSYQNESKISLELRKRDGGLLHRLSNFETGLINRLESFRESNEFFIYSTNFISASTFRCLITIKQEIQCALFNQTQIPGIDPANFIHEQFFYPSKNGTLLPMEILRRKDWVPDGATPLILQSRHVRFASRTGLVFVENFNGILAFIQTRDERENKKSDQGFQHGYLVEDMEAAAEYLIQNNFTRSNKLAIIGNWAVAACVNQRPDLYGAAIVKGGGTDLIGYHLQCPFCHEFGTPEEENNFKNLFKYSPLHNIRLPPKEIKYPAIFVCSRIATKSWEPPAQAFKYVAELQYRIGTNSNQMNPLLLHVDNRSHIPYPDVDRFVDNYAFLAEVLDLEFRE